MLRPALPCKMAGRKPDEHIDAFSFAPSVVSDTYFDELIAHLRSHTESLKELQAPDLATCLKIASEQDNAQKKHWLTLVKMQGRFSLEQQQELQGLMLQICVVSSEGANENASSADGQPLQVSDEEMDAETFARVIRILQECEQELRSLGKSSLAACFNANRKAADKDWTFCRNFLNVNTRNVPQSKSKSWRSGDRQFASLQLLLTVRRYGPPEWMPTRLLVSFVLWKNLKNSCEG